MDYSSLQFPGKRWLKARLWFPFCRRTRCLFVLSTGRCGTASLTRLLALSPEIHSYHEPKPPFLQESQQAYLHGPLLPPQQQAFASHFLNLRARQLLSAYRQQVLYAECSNRLSFLAPALAHCFPQSRFIHLYRHPADVVRSGMRRGYYTGYNNWDRYRIVPRSDDPAAAEWSQWDELAKVCWFWKATNAYCRQWTLETPDRCFSLAAEALFTDPAATDHLFDWLGLARLPREQTDQLRATPENAQRTGDFPDWPAWSEDQRCTLRSIAGEVADQLGYDLRETESTATRAAFQPAAPASF